MRAGIAKALRSLKEAKGDIYQAANASQDAARDHRQNANEEDAVSASEASGALWEVANMINAVETRLRWLRKAYGSAVDDPYA